MNSEISILLASYNGERYIEQQLLSLIGQTYKEWRLYVSVMMALKMRR